MSDGLWTQWIARVKAPRAGQVRALAGGAAAATVELDNDIFQFTSQSPIAPAVNMNYGQAIMRVYCTLGNATVLFGSSAAAVANVSAANNATAANAGATIASNTFQDFEINPNVDKFMGYIGNGTTIQYYIRTEPKSSTGFGA